LIFVISSVFNAKYKHVGAMSYGEKESGNRVEAMIEAISSPSTVYEGRSHLIAGKVQ
jgi:hypothetical protein